MSDSVAIISDIHGNLQALEAVIADIQSRGIHDRVCLGDIVGYGAQPAECLELLQAENFEVIQGNHDAYVADDSPLPEIGDEIMESVRLARRALTTAQRSWLGALPLTLMKDDFEAVHASLHHPEQWGYVLEPGSASLHFAHQRRDVCFIGHSHQPKMFVEGEDRALDITSIEDLRIGKKQVINVGSVGQPRDRDERACYVVFRRQQADVLWRRIDYDIEGAQRAITAAGLPGKFAHRLAVGR